MSITYRVAPGDTFELIARKLYGQETDADLLRLANPGTAEPLVAGNELAVPENPNDATLVPGEGEANFTNEFAIKINGERYRYWDGLTVTREIDSMDTFTFTAPLEAITQAQRDTFRPFSYQRVEITVGGDRLFTGVLVGIEPAIEPESKSLVISGYSLPGVMGDCMMPASAYPLEFNKMSLSQIAASLARAFGIGVVFEADAGPRFDRVALEPDGSPLSFLIKLANQRGLIVGSTAEGRLLFTQSADTTSSVTKLIQGAPPLVSLTPRFNAQSYYSHITGRRPTRVGQRGAQYTVKNPRLTGVIRPYSFEVPDVEGGSLKAAVEAKAGRMFGDMASYDAVLAQIRDSSGVLWAPNLAYDVTGPEAMIYNGYRFIGRSVEFTKTSDTEAAVINLVMPGAYSGEIPRSLPWDS